MVWESKAAGKVDDLLESFMGIRDLELGIHTATVDSYISWWEFLSSLSALLLLAEIELSMIVSLTIFLLSFSSPSSNNGGLGQGKVIDG